MATLPEVLDDPRSLDDLCDALERIHRESAEYWRAYDDTEFFAPMGEKWSAADHVRHLTRSMRPVAKALRLPRWVLRIAFARPSRPSRSFATLREDYHGVLAAGGQAGGYAPAPLTAEDRTPEMRTKVMAYHATAVEGLVSVARRWRDGALDGATLPHPLLGPLTLREMLMFMLYHNLHHVHVAERRRIETKLDRSNRGTDAS
jgi:hypothetical protein